MGDLLHPNGSLCSGPRGPVAPAALALQTQRPLWRDHRRVLTGAAPHQVTESKRTGEHRERADGQRAEPVHTCGERGGGRPASPGSAQL